MNEIKQNDILMNDILMNDILMNEILMNDILMNDIQQNDIQQNDIQQNVIQQNDIQQNDIQQNDNQMNGIRHFGTDCPVYKLIVVWLNVILLSVTRAPIFMFPSQIINGTREKTLTVVNYRCKIIS